MKKLFLFISLGLLISSSLLFGQTKQSAYIKFNSTSTAGDDLLGGFRNSTDTTNHGAVDDTVAPSIKFVKDWTRFYVTTYGVGNPNLSWDDSTSVWLGNNAGLNNTATYFVNLGYNSGNSNIASYQSAFGYSSGIGNEGIYQNTFGAISGQYNIGANQNAFGNLAGYYNEGHHENAIGDGAGMYNTGDFVTALGDGTAFYNEGRHENAIGYGAGQFNTGNIVTAIGDFAGNHNTGDSSIFLGPYSGNYNTIEGRLVIDPTITSSPLIIANAKTDSIGFNGYIDVRDYTKAGDSIQVGGVYFDENDLGAVGGTVTSVTAGDGMNFSTITATGPITMGTPSNITSTSTNSVSGTTHTHALDNTGVVAGSYTNTNITVDAKGRLTAAGNGTSGSVSINGTPSAGQIPIWTDANTIEGKDSLKWINGKLVLLGNQGRTSVGYNNSDNGTGTSSFGYNANASITSGNYNTSSGQSAGSAITTGSSNTNYGYNSGSAINTESGCINLGKDAGSANTNESNVLYIENSNADKFNALIWGDFANDSLRLNAKVRMKDSTYLDYLAPGGMPSTGTFVTIGPTRALDTATITPAGEPITYKEYLPDFKTYYNDTEKIGKYDERNWITGFDTNKMEFTWTRTLPPTMKAFEILQRGIEQRDEYINELYEQNESQQIRIEKLEKENADYKARIEAIEKKLGL